MLTILDSCDALVIFSRPAVLAHRADSQHVHKKYGPYCCMTFATLFAWSSDNFWFMATLPTDGLAFYLDM
jgi:hypothetical protein